MGSTPNLGLPIPDIGQQALGSSQIGALALALDKPGVLYRPYVELLAAAATTGIVTAIETKVLLANTNHLDGGSDHYTVASSVVTIVQSGLYNISGEATVGTFGTSAYVTIVRTSGTYKYLAINYRMGSVSADSILLQAGDTIELRIYQTSGSNQPTLHITGSGQTISRLAIRRVG